MKEDNFIAENDQSLEAVLIKRREIEQDKNPDISLKDSVVLKQGPRAYKVATHWIIIDRNTGEVHHHAVKIETLRRRKSGWLLDEERSITLDDSKGDEIKPLETFLGVVRGANMPEKPGDYLVVPVTDEGVNKTSLRRFLDAISTAEKGDFVAQVLLSAKGDPDLLQAIVDSASKNPESSREAVAAINIARFNKAIEKLEYLIESNANERELQTHLSGNPWMFGSEYSELLDQRKWTRNEEQDFVLRRTADGYLEIIEIKTTLDGKQLFANDRSHGTFYPRSELSAVVGQVLHYLDELDASRYAIESKDGENVHKIRAKIIIGRDGELEQINALRRLNGHLYRVEVLTFDQLLRITRQVLSHLRQVIQ
jgi:hypothetical protein